MAACCLPLAVKMRQEPGETLCATAAAEPAANAAAAESADLADAAAVRAAVAGPRQAWPRRQGLLHCNWIDDSSSVRMRSVATVASLGVRSRFCHILMAYTNATSY